MPPATINPPCCTLLLVVAVALSACGKAQDKAAEKVVEKAIESSMSKDGTSAKVDLSQGAMKVTTTDASGKTTQMEMGSAKISEADPPFCLNSVVASVACRFFSVCWATDNSRSSARRCRAASRP